MSIPSKLASDPEQIVYIGLGGNVGDVVSSMVGALNSLNGNEAVRVVARSALYCTPPWGDENQADFVNACAKLETGLGPEALLALLKKQEARLLRKQTRRWGPRTIDLDILLFGDRDFRSEILEIPHPRMHQRAFVLMPLADIAVGDEIVRGKTIAKWLEACDQRGITRLEDQKGWVSGRV